MTESKPGGNERESLSANAVSSALVRVADLWPEGLDAVPGSYEITLKRDADTIRALATFWREAQEERSLSNRTPLRCRLFGHDYEIAKHDPRPREYRPNGRPKLRKALAFCSRCGKRLE